MRRPLLYGLCGVALATGLGTVIALAGDNGDNPGTGPSVVTDGHHQLFLVRVPQGQDHIQVVPLDGPALPDDQPVPDAPTPSAPAPSAPTPSAPSVIAPLFVPSAEPSKESGPCLGMAPEPKPVRKAVAPPPPMPPTPEPTLSRRASGSEVASPPPPNPDPPVSLGMPAMDRIVETARQSNRPIATSPVPPQAQEDSPRPVEDSPRVLLRRARELYAQNKFRESEALARHVSVMLVKWGPDEDTPNKLLSDIQIARQAALQPTVPAQPKFPVIAGMAARLNPHSDTAPAAQLVPPTPPAPSLPAPPVPPTPPTPAQARNGVVQVGAVEPPLVPVPVEPAPSSAFATQPALAPRVTTPTSWQSPAQPLTTPPAPSPNPVLSPPTPMGSPTPTVAPAPMASLTPMTPLPTDAASHPGDESVIDSEEHWQGHSTFVAGDVGFGFVRPYIKNDPAFFVSTGGNPSIARQMEFNPGTQFLPEVSLSVVGPEDWGGRIRWWGFATSATEGVTGNARTVTAAPLGLGFVSTSPADVLTASTKLGMDVADFEATHDFHGCNWAIQVAGGFRYAHIDQRYNVGDLSGGTTSMLISGQNFNGFGPTLFARGRWQVAGTKFYLFGAGRGSLLYGKAQQDAWLDQPAGIVNAAISSRMVMPVGEMEMGMGYRRVWRGTDLFFEMGLDYQNWFEAGSASRSTIEPNSPAGATGVVSSTADYNLGLMALTFRLGLNY
jgi:hypothetical protein